uniref:TPR_REGION domain-containing protein n=1 Tax=Macrostomum lignano TaxID=282301 RepID=A0A1I8FI53_9PLAT
EDQEDALMRPRTVYGVATLEADLEQALVKFKEAEAAASSDKTRWPEVLAAQTGQAEISIQKKEWAAAINQLTASLRPMPPLKRLEMMKLPLQPPPLAISPELHYMLGIALLGQSKIDEAKAEFESARTIANDAPDAVDMLDRLEQLDEVEEDDLVEIALEFGVAPEGSFVGEEDDEEEDFEERREREEEEEEDEDSSRGQLATVNSRKRRAAAGVRANAARGEEDDEMKKRKIMRTKKRRKRKVTRCQQKRARQLAAGSRNGRRAVAASSEMTKTKWRTKRK